MGKYEIYGGRKLSGSVEIESAKNAVLPLLAGSILTSEQVIIENCPKIQDVINMIKILQGLGVKATFQEKNLVIDAKNLNSCAIPQGLGKELRSSIFMLGSLLSRVGKANISYPGGCDIGLRPIDIHLTALKSMGVELNETLEGISCTVNKLKGRDIYLDFPSVGATENIMLSAVLADGKTQIRNPAREPEIVDLMNFLNSMGAKVYGAGTSTILIEGVKRLHGTTYRPIGDRIEVGTFMIATAIAGGEVEIKGVNAKNISSLIHKLCDNTCKITINNDIIYIKNGVVRKSFGLVTAPYPAFPTDLQAQTTALLSVCEGDSVVTENMFETRFNHIPELVKMGAKISVKGRTAFIHGVKELFGAEVYAKDLRGGASLVLAGLVANGKTTVNDICHIERGYLDLHKKLVRLGAQIEKI